MLVWLIALFGEIVVEFHNFHFLLQIDRLSVNTGNRETDYQKFNLKRFFRANILV